MTLSLDTNLADLPFALQDQLSSVLSSNDTWLKVVDTDKKDAFYSSPEEIDKVAKSATPGRDIIQRWANRGQTVQSLMARLQWLSAINGGGGTFDKPQLVLHRKFKAVRWVNSNQVRIKLNDDNLTMNVEAVAIGFPSPQFQWERDGVPFGEPGQILRLYKCKCELQFSYVCRVWNEIDDGQIFSSFYRDGKKEYCSEIRSNAIDVSTQVQTGYACDRCKAHELEMIREKLGGAMIDAPSDPENIDPLPLVPRERFVAADKVALIIANCNYRHLGSLITPLCDAETLAESLQEMNFKTITLADLTMSEMRFMITEYKKILGDDVYAVFYFAGHGFEVNGQCYLLPIDAPVDAHSPEHSLSMDWVLATLADYSPALHVILLDVCRKYIPAEYVPDFIQEAEKFKKRHTANRNTVYGYSTSGGVGAYEVRGETNGVFMKYLKAHANARLPVVDMLQRVFVDIEEDTRVTRVQIPELRTSLTKPRSLRDDLVCDGHTASFDQHNVHWTHMHDLPTPVRVRFSEEELLVIIWFQYCGHFTNKVYIFSSVEELHDDGDVEEEVKKERALRYLAYLRFDGDLEATNSREIRDDEEGVSIGVLLHHLQRSNGQIECTVDLKDETKDEIIASKKANLGPILITKIQESLRR